MTNPISYRLKWHLFRISQLAKTQFLYWQLQISYLKYLSPKWTGSIFSYKLLFQNENTLFFLRNKWFSISPAKTALCNVVNVLWKCGHHHTTSPIFLQPYLSYLSPPPPTPLFDLPKGKISKISIFSRRLYGALPIISNFFIVFDKFNCCCFRFQNNKTINKPFKNP